MNIQIFTKCFEKLCLSFDLDYDKKKNRIETYYDSKLGDLSEHVLLEVIKTAKQTLDIKPGYLPSIKQLEGIYYSRPIRTRPPEESFRGATCPICDGIGFVSLWKDGYRFGGFCCTCIKDQNKQANTKIGRETGSYIDALNRGYTMED